MTWTKELIALRKKLAELYPTKADTDLVLDTINLDKTFVAYNDRPINHWNNIMNEANIRGQLLALAEYVGSDFPNDAIVQTGVQFIIAQTKAPIVHDVPSNDFDIKEDAPLSMPRQKGVDFIKSKALLLVQEDNIEQAIDILLAYVNPTSGNDKTNFILLSGRNTRNNKNNNIGILSSSDYTVERNKIRQSLIIYINELPNDIEASNAFKSPHFSVSDDRHLEKILRSQDSLVQIGWLNKGWEVSRSVCRVICKNGEMGTGFIIEGGYLVTNNHVIPDAATAMDARIELNYQADFNGMLQLQTVYKLDASDFKTSHKTLLDYTKVKIIDKPDSPLSNWGVLDIETTPTLKRGEPLSIIQHPSGGLKQVSFGVNDMIGVWKEKLFYRLDTEPGSSGSPVFDKNWKVIALHHAGKTMADGGLQVNEKGDRKGANEGILMAFIVKDWL